jgi:hypothetical protein
VLAHQEHLHSTGIGAEREAARLDVELAERMSAALLARWKASTDADLIRVALERIIARELTPAQTVTQFLTHKEKS